jgi:ACR3 family arsenite efflux pump ArsB
MISALIACAIGTLLIGLSFVIVYLGMKADPKQGLSYVAGGMMMKMVLGSALSVGCAMLVPDFNVAAFGLVISVFLGVGIPAVAIYGTRNFR